MTDAKIIVLTPVKNEAWIIEKFLTCTSFFADHIIIADQKSDDGSEKIYAKFPKVTVVENNNSKYDEASRQILLIDTARKLFPDVKRILFCLDADEIFSADSLSYNDVWERIRLMDPGTSIYLEKPDLLKGIQRGVRWRDNYFPIGYIDDGMLHSPTVIHSKRIPENAAGADVYINELKVLHFAHTRRNVQSAKLRYYSVIENINHSKSFYIRRYAYKSFYNEEKNYPPENIELMPAEWLKGWDDLNIDLRHLPDPEYSWHDFEVLNYFNQYGYERFHTDDIWDFDWEACRKFALERNLTSNTKPVVEPGFLKKVSLKLLDKLYLFYRKVKN